VAPEPAMKAATTHQHDFVAPYVSDLTSVIDVEAIRLAGLKLGVDPLGGASLPYWEPINAEYGLNVDIVNKKVDPTFSFMTVDHDGKIRMDCSSPYAMASLVGLKDRYQVAFGNDTDSDRHGIVTSVGRAAESQSLSGGGDPVFARASRGVAAGRGRRQDAGLQQHDRSRGEKAGSDIVGKLYSGIGADIVMESITLIDGAQVISGVLRSNIGRESP